MHNDSTQFASTGDEAYTRSLIRKQTVWWKRLVDVQAPYRWNLRRLRPGYTLEIGCGIGRNLEHLRGTSVGIDHNPASVEFARSRGHLAFTPEEFRQSTMNVRGLFDSLLLAHVVEHMTRPEAVHLIREYLALLKPGGLIILITPQEAGFRSDPTHVEFMDFPALESIQLELGTELYRHYSFPFPRPVGKVFMYNEFVSVGRRRPQGA